MTVASPISQNSHHPAIVTKDLTIIEKWRQAPVYGIDERKRIKERPAKQVYRLFMTRREVDVRKKKPSQVSVWPWRRRRRGGDARSMVARLVCRHSSVSEEQ